jgi:hypothetical protein
MCTRCELKPRAARALWVSGLPPMDLRVACILRHTGRAAKRNCERLQRLADCNHIPRVDRLGAPAAVGTGSVRIHIAPQPAHRAKRCPRPESGAGKTEPSTALHFALQISTRNGGRVLPPRRPDLPVPDSAAHRVGRGAAGCGNSRCPTTPRRVDARSLARCTGPRSAGRARRSMRRIVRS